MKQVKRNISAYKRQGKKPNAENGYKLHCQRYKKNRQMIKQFFPTKEEMELVIPELKKWPTYKDGTPMSGIRSRLAYVLGYDPSDEHTREKLNILMELLGSCICGLHTWVDKDGNVWGPPPEETNSNFNLRMLKMKSPFNYSNAEFKDNKWVPLERKSHATS